MRNSQCLGCGHDHEGRKCTAHTTLEGYRGKDGRCTCPKFVKPEFSPEKRKAIHLGQIKAAFAASRAR